MTTLAKQAQMGQTRTDWRIVKRLLAYLGQHKKLLLFAMCLYPLDAIAVILPPYLVQQILDVAIPTRDIGLLHVLVLGYLAALALEFVSGFFSQLAMSILGQRAMVSVRRDLLNHVQKLPTAYYDKNPIGRTLTRLTNDVEALGEVFATGAVTVIADIVVIIAVVSMMLWLDVGLTLFAFLVVPPLVLMAVVFQRIARQAFRAIRLHLARINAFLSEHLSGMSVVQIFGQEERTEREFHTLNVDYRNANRSAILFDALLFSLVEAIGTCAVAAMIWYGAKDMSAGLIGAGTLVAFIQYIRRFFVPIRDLSTKYTIWQSGFASAERVFELLDEPVAIESPPAAKRVSSLSTSIDMRDVWFAYKEQPSDEDYVLKGISLSVKRGERVALVGATGSGKTTILKLITRLYDVQKGSIAIDGHNVRSLDVGALRRLYAVVLQDVYLFAGSIMDNLRLGDDISEHDVMQAAAAVQADAFIDRLPDGYQTQVQQTGLNFSAGERQLLAFARALALNPDVLVLDEATSNVDSETEARIQGALDVLLKDRTAIIVAHRLSTIRKADRILVLQNGTLAEEGSHDALMAKGGLYKQLVELQLAEELAAP